MEGLVKTINDRMLPIDPKILSTIRMGPLNQYENILAFSVIKNQKDTVNTSFFLSGIHFRKWKISTINFMWLTY